MSVNSSPSSEWHLDSEWIEHSLRPTSDVQPTGLAMSSTPQTLSHRLPSSLLPSPVVSLPSEAECSSPNRARKRALHRDLDVARRARERTAMDRLHSLVLLSMGSDEASYDTRAETAKRLDKVAVLEAAAARLAALQQRVASIPSPPSSSLSHIEAPALFSSQRRQKSRFHARKVACVLCRSRKSTCDGARPCSRCVKLGVDTECVDRGTIGDTGVVGNVDSVFPAACDGQIVLADPTSEDDVLRPWAGTPSTLTAWTSSGNFHSSTLLLSHSSMFGVVPEHVISKAHSSHFLMDIHVDRVPKHLTSAVSRKKNSLRDEYVYWSWLNSMMTEQDVQSVVHAAVSSIKHWHDEIQGFQHHHSFITLSNMARQRLSSRSSSTTQDPLRTHTHCDGSLCGHCCTFFRALSNCRPCRFIWVRSPEGSIPDSRDAPNHPLIIIDYLQTEEESHRQNAELEEIGFTLAKNLIETERTEQGCPSVSAPTVGNTAAHDGMIGHHNGGYMDVPMSVRVNASFERLLGYSQSEVRQLFGRVGELAFFQLIKADGWSRFMELDFDAKWEVQSEYCLYVMCSTKWQTSVPCLLHCMNSFGNAGNLSKRTMSFIRLPGYADQRQSHADPMPSVWRGSASWAELHLQ